MFDLRDFVMRTLRGMAETEPGYKVNQYALGWFDRQVLTAEDLAVVDALTGVVEPEIEPIEPTPEGEIDTGEVVEPTPEGGTGTETTEPTAEEGTEPVVEGEPEATTEPEGDTI